MFDPKSSYALNKRDKDAIVYPCAGEPPIRLTSEDFETEKDFQTWKAWSDANYHDEEKADHIYFNHTVPLDIAESAAGAVPSPEVVIERRIERMENERYSEEVTDEIRGHLTKKQFRRFWQHHVDGLGVEAIARSEGKAHSSISESIQSAKEKILSLGLKNPTDRP